MESLGILAIATCEAGDGRTALQAVQRARELLAGVGADKIEFHHLLIEAYAFLRMGRQQQARPLLRRAFAIGRDRGYIFGFAWAPSMLTSLCAEALQAGIETQYASHLIQRLGLLPPRGESCENWPWQVKVRIFDGLEVEVEGRPLVFSRKAQKKPLELLSALVAEGSPGVDRGLLAQHLWPDSEGDAAESALRMNLHRLRKLLRRDEAIVMQDGKVRLNDRVAWVDAWVFEAACAELEETGEGESTLGGAVSMRDRVLKLYRGQAFGREAPLPWMLPARERWRGKFVAAVARLGGLEEGREDWAGAASSYRRALEADPLTEEMYRRLMRVYLRQGKHAEAYAVYRGCREMLSIMLGVSPSDETEALRRAVAAHGADGQLMP
ncbi:MAG TPA: bacterial transcriptional activator domain-containing protein [Burkholderiales bacterium]|nr:bacterial transcriptional activator domain-containing protein [Burkholderiales bacterium]